MSKLSTFTLFGVRFSPVAFDDGKRAVIIDTYGSSDVIFFRGGLPSVWYGLKAGCWYHGSVVVAVTPSGRRRVVDILDAINA